MMLFRPSMSLLISLLLLFSFLDPILSFAVPNSNEHSLSHKRCSQTQLTDLFCRHPYHCPQSSQIRLLATRHPPSSTRDVDNNDDDDSDVPWYDNLDILQGNSDEDEFFYDEDTFEDWIPDAKKATKKPTHLTPAKEVLGKENNKADTNIEDKTANSSGTQKSPYTDEEEELIEAMGGNKKTIQQSKREEGFLGDSTLKDIATDYSVPICYLADVLCMWKVPVPISIHDRLGDMVTGEQAFALVEAIHTLDVGALNDRYSNENMLQVCSGWDIDINDAFQFAMKEGWSLPFGVRTNLRMEQEEELLRVFSSMYEEDDEEDNV